MAWMMSAPVPDWIAEVMRACRSLPLMVLNVILSPQRLLRLRQQLLAQQRVGGGNEIAEPQPVQRGVLRVGGRPAGGQDASQRAAADQRVARSLEELATINSHGAS